MKLALTLAATALLAVPVAAQQRTDDPDQKVAGGGALPAGWSGRVDRPTQSLADLKFAPMGNGLHATTGPHVILWREADNVTGGAHVVATLVRTKAPPHPESYGLFFGGKDLKGDGQSYTYVLVRGDGKFMVRKRNGATTETVVNWTDHAAVAKADASGKATDKIEITIQGGKVAFSINGQQVHSMDAPAGSANGFAGIRMSHNLDVHIDGFAVHRM
jgi:hypothetical protein